MKYLPFFIIYIMKNKKKLYIILTLIIAFHSRVYAAPSDYGRDFYSTSFSVTIGQILLAVILVLLGYVGIKSIFKKNKNNRKAEISNSALDRNREDSKNVCPKCNGQLFIELGELSSCRRELSSIDRGELIFYWGQGKHGPIECVRRVCPYCKGRGEI